MNQIAVIGLGKLGSPMVACLAAKGFQVTGVDFDPAKVEQVGRGMAPVEEPGLAEMMQAHKNQISATTDGCEASRKSQATFMIVPTPSSPAGDFSLKYILSACEAMGDALRETSAWHLVVITSTVSPGSMDTVIKPALEQRSGKRCGIDFGLCYSPEFIALGAVIHGLQRPDFLLIGESDKRAGDALSEIYSRMCENQPSSARMNFVNAELCKLSVNAYVTTKMSFANQLARLCERLPGADVDVVTQALGMDSRIGKKYLKGAVAYGGPCFPRDNVALVTLARSLGCAVPLAEATDTFNRQQTVMLADLVQSHLPDGGQVGILGLTYKPDTPVLDESPGLLLALELIGRGVSLRAFDPATLVGLPESVKMTSSASDCIASSDVVVVITAWAEFKSLSLTDFAKTNKSKVLIDCWRLYEQQSVPANLKYVKLGMGPALAAELQTEAAAR